MLGDVACCRRGYASILRCLRAEGYRLVQRRPDGMRQLPSKLGTVVLSLLSATTWCDSCQPEEHAMTAQ